MFLTTTIIVLCLTFGVELRGVDDVGRPPYIKPFYYYEQFAAAAANFNLDCSASGYPKPNVTWYYKKFSSSDYDVVANTPVIGRDYLLNVTYEFTEYSNAIGIYKCTAENMYGVAFSSLTYVNSTPSFSIHKEQPEYKLKAGQSFILNMTENPENFRDIRPQTQSWWQCNDYAVQPIAPSILKVQETQRIVYGNDYDLIFIYLIPGDEDMNPFQGFKENPGFRFNVIKTDYLYIKVEGTDKVKDSAPKWASLPQKVEHYIYGDKINLKCIAFGYPFAETVFTIPENVPNELYSIQEYGRTFHMEKAVYEANGDYECYAINKLGQTPVHKFSIFVEGPPVFTSPTNYGVSIQNGAERQQKVFFKINSIPKPKQVVVKRNGVKISSGDYSRVTFEVGESGVNFTVQIGKLSDTATYQVEATNTKTTTVFNYFVNVIPLIIVDYTKNAKAFPNSRITLFCQAYAYPNPEFQWKANIANMQYQRTWTYSTKLQYQVGESDETVVCVACGEFYNPRCKSQNIPIEIVNVKPIPPSSGKKLFGRTNDSSINCSFEAVASEFKKIYWQFSNNTFKENLDSSGKPVISSVADLPGVKKYTTKLSLQGLATNDGKYRCVAESTSMTVHIDQDIIICGDIPVNIKQTSNENFVTVEITTIPFHSKECPKTEHLILLYKTDFTNGKYIQLKDYKLDGQLSVKDDLYYPKDTFVTLRSYGISPLLSGKLSSAIRFYLQPGAPHVNLGYNLEIIPWFNSFFIHWNVIPQYYWGSANPNLTLALKRIKNDVFLPEQIIQMYPSGGKIFISNCTGGTETAMKFKICNVVACTTEYGRRVNILTTTTVPEFFKFVNITPSSAVIVIKIMNDDVWKNSVHTYKVEIRYSTFMQRILTSKIDFEESKEYIFVSNLFSTTSYEFTLAIYKKGHGVVVGSNITLPKLETKNICVAKREACIIEIRGHEFNFQGAFLIQLTRTDQGIWASEGHFYNVTVTTRKRPNSVPTSKAYLIQSKDEEFLEKPSESLHIPNFNKSLYYSIRIDPNVNPALRHSITLEYSEDIRYVDEFDHKAIIYGGESTGGLNSSCYLKEN